MTSVWNTLAFGIASARSRILRISSPWNAEAIVPIFIITSSALVVLVVGQDPMGGRRFLDAAPSTHQSCPGRKKVKYMGKKTSYIPMIMVFVLLAANMAVISYMSSRSTAGRASSIESVIESEDLNDNVAPGASGSDVGPYDNMNAGTKETGSTNNPSGGPSQGSGTQSTENNALPSDGGGAAGKQDSGSQNTTGDTNDSPSTPDENDRDAGSDSEDELNLSYPGGDDEEEEDEIDCGSDNCEDNEPGVADDPGANGNNSDSRPDKIEYDFDYPERWGCASNEAELSRLKVEVEIENSYAVTDIQFGLTNPTANVTRNSFTVTIPEDAMFSNLTMELNGKVYHSKIFPKTEQGTEMTGPDIMAVFIQWLSDDRMQMNIRVPPQSVMGINIRYETFLARYLGEFSYTVPLGGINSYETIKELLVVLDVYHQSGLDTLSVSGPIHENNLTVTEAQAAGIKKHVNVRSVQSLILTYTVGEPPIEGDVTVHEDEDGGYFLLRFSPSAAALEEAPVPKQIIFVIDRSGSMSGNKISQVRDAFAYIVDDLPEDDMFNILTFSGGVSQYSSEMIPASEYNKKSAVSFIDGISATGGTNFNQAALDALSLLEGTGENYIPIVVLLTDGNPTSGETDIETIRNNIMAANTMHSSVFCLGFGGDVDFDFLRAISLDNYGQGIKINTYGNPTTQITDFYRTISTPLLQQLTFGFSDGVYDVSRTRADYLFAGTDIVVTGRFSGLETLDIRIDARSRAAQRTFSNRVCLEGENHNPFVARMWAYQQIESILERMEVFGETQDLRERVMELSCQYNFLTKYTCFLVEVNDEEVWNPENAENDDVQPDPEPEEEPDDDPDDDTNSTNRSRSWNPLDVPDGSGDEYRSERHNAGYEAGDEKKALIVRKSD